MTSFEWKFIDFVQQDNDSKITLLHGCSKPRQIRICGVVSLTACELGEEKGADLRSFFRGRVLSACALRVVASSVAFREEAPFRRCPPPVAPLLPF